MKYNRIDKFLSLCGFLKNLSKNKIERREKLIKVEKCREKLIRVDKSR